MCCPAPYTCLAGFFQFLGVSGTGCGLIVCLVLSVKMDLSVFFIGCDQNQVLVPVGVGGIDV